MTTQGTGPDDIVIDSMTFAEVQSANRANLGLHPDGRAMPRCRPPHGFIARKDPFRLGIPPSRRP